MNPHAETNANQSIINSPEEKGAHAPAPVESAYYEGKIQLSYKSE